MYVWLQYPQLFGPTDHLILIFHPPDLSCRYHLCVYVSLFLSFVIRVGPHEGGKGGEIEERGIGEGEEWAWN